MHLKCILFYSIRTIVIFLQHTLTYCYVIAPVGYFFLKAGLTLKIIESIKHGHSFWVGKSQLLNLHSKSNSPDGDSWGYKKTHCPSEVYGKITFCKCFIDKSVVILFESH